MSSVPGPDAGGNERKGHKRKHSETLSIAQEGDAADALLREIQIYIEVLRTTFSHLEKHRAAARQAAHNLADFAKKGGNIDILVQNGAVDALVPHLSAPPLLHRDDHVAYEHEVEKDAAFALGLLAIKPEHQRLIADAGALPALIALLQRPATYGDSRLVYGAIRRAADAITNMAHENANIKSRVRTEGAIPPLVSLLECPDTKVQRAAAGALRTLAFKNEQNKVQIVECQALPTLVFMLRSEDVGIHYEAVGVLGNLVHSSPTIKKRVLEEGALQPVISLLSSRCPESQREAALLLGQFSTAEPDCKVRIVQRGAVRPLIKMLEAPDLQLKEMAAFALGRLAQNKDNEAGIVHDGGLRPLLDLLDSKNGAVQHNASFALYGLADNEDNLAEIVREGGVEKLMEAELILQASKDCVQKTLKRLEEKISGRVLRHLLYLLRSVDKETQRRVAIALAHLSGEDDQRLIFVDGGGLEVLLDMMGSTMTPKLQKEGALAVYTLAKKAAALSPVENAPPPPTPQVYLGEQYVNCPTLSDVSFVVEGRRFYAHRIALLASSDAFRAMFDGGYREKQAEDIEIPNISWKVFEAMMRSIYTGTVDVTPDFAQDLLRAADQYLLEGLKRQCEYAIAKDLSVDCVSDVYELAEAYHASTLRHQCVIFTLEHHEQTSALPTYTTMIQRMVPEIREYIHRVLRPKQAPPPAV